VAIHDQMRRNPAVLILHLGTLRRSRLAQLDSKEKSRPQSLSKAEGAEPSLRLLLLAPSASAAVETTTAVKASA
jgi:hypothetical protein